MNGSGRSGSGERREKRPRVRVSMPGDPTRTVSRRTPSGALIPSPFHTQMNSPYNSPFNSHSQTSSPFANSPMAALAFRAGEGAAERGLGALVRGARGRRSSRGPEFWQAFLSIFFGRRSGGDNSSSGGSSGANTSGASSGESAGSSPTTANASTSPTHRTLTPTTPTLTPTPTTLTQSTPTTPTQSTPSWWFQRLLPGARRGSTQSAASEEDAFATSRSHDSVATSYGTAVSELDLGGNGEHSGNGEYGGNGEYAGSRSAGSSSRSASGNGNGGGSASPSYMLQYMSSFTRKLFL